MKDMKNHETVRHLAYNLIPNFLNHNLNRKASSG